jgi:hypothetical protein
MDVISGMLWTLVAAAALVFVSLLALGIYEAFRVDVQRWRVRRDLRRELEREPTHPEVANRMRDEWRA